MRLTEAEANTPSVANWTQEEVSELLMFVVDNGYIRRGTVVLKQVMGFGMGLACAGQMANLGCYPVERDYAEGKAPKDVEHNYRFIDDIETLTGSIPTEEQYGMRYKSTRVREGEIVYLGMEQKWVVTKNGVKFITGMHFRDATYPIKIRRYPGEGSMVTDSQRIGVITGQFIRAQRLCSTLCTFKDAVQNVALAAMRRGYKRRELDRVWGKFLVSWWKAEEIRRGELRSWFRKMTVVVHKRVQQENLGQEQSTNQDQKRPCKFGNRCFWKEFACPFAHPGVGATQAATREGDNAAKKQKAPRVEGTDEQGPKEAEGKAEGGCPVGTGEVSVSVEEEVDRGRRKGDGERVPKACGKIWSAVGDGSCLFYSVAGVNSKESAMWLRHALAHHVRQAWTDEIEGLDLTTGELLNHLGWEQARYLQSVISTDHWGDELELILLSRITEQRFRVFEEQEDGWHQYAEYGTKGPILRLRFRPGTRTRPPHYDLLLVREAWEKERQQVEAEEARQGRGGEPGKKVKDLLIAAAVKETMLASIRQDVLSQRRRRQAEVKASRARERFAEEFSQDVELLASLAEDPCTLEQLQAMGQTLGHTMP